MSSAAAINLINTVKFIVKNSLPFFQIPQWNFHSVNGKSSELSSCTLSARLDFKLDDNLIRISNLKHTAEKFRTIEKKKSIYR